VTSVVGDEVFGIEMAACAEGAIGTKIAMDHEHQRSARLEGAEDNALGIRGFRWERAISDAFQATRVSIAQSSADVIARDET
jgi:hypothetical protein